MYVKATTTTTLGAGVLAVTGRPVWGLVLFGLAMVLLGLLLLRAVSVRAHR